MTIARALSVAALVLSTAATGHAATVGLTGRTLTNIVAYDDYVILQFTPASETSVTGCAKAHQAFLDLSNGKGQALYTAAMAAALAGKTVELKIRGGVCDPAWNAAQLYQINISF